jgi:hypothetical protein
MFYIRQMLDKKWEYNDTVHQLFVGFKKACQLGGKHHTAFMLSLEYPESWWG